MDSHELWGWGRFIANHGIPWTIDEGQLWALDRYTHNGVYGEKWIKLTCGREVYDWLGY